MVKVVVGKFTVKLLQVRMNGKDGSRVNVGGPFWDVSYKNRALPEIPFGELSDLLDAIDHALECDVREATSKSAT